MCGIAGYYHLPLSLTEREYLLKRMCNTMIHRGPDDEGYYEDEQVGLGMRRLSIIDLVSGHQPMASSNGKKWLVFNGEIYNYKELRTMLQAKGHNFHTNSDTEVILAQYEEDGFDCVHHFNGMFAFALWDSESQCLFLARDRMGVKPLYYYWDGKAFLFASEIKALLASGFVSKTINPQAVWDYLTFRYVPQPETIWKNIYKLKPAHILTISKANNYPTINRYWDIPYTDEVKLRSEEEWEAEFEALFTDAVCLRLNADVPVGILLSGGLDSSSVAAVVADNHQKKVNSFSVSFANSPNYNELPYARLVAKALGVAHHEIIIHKEDVINFLEDFVYYTDEPLADLASIPLFYVSKLAHKDVKVVLSGEGSDEVLGGYSFDSLLEQWQAQRAKQGSPSGEKNSAWYKNALHLLLGKHKRNSTSSYNAFDMRTWEIPMNMTFYLSTEQKKQIFLNNEKFIDSQELLRNDIKRVNSRELLNQALYIYCQSWLVEDLLMKADRMSMANSIELRTPFLDYRIVEWAATTPPSIRVGKDKTGKYVTKKVLRKFAEKKLPSPIIHRTKMGFPVPLYDWLHDEVKDWAFDMLSSKNAKVNDWFDRKWIYDVLNVGTQQNGEILNQHRLWNLLILEIWMKKWIE